MTNRETTLLDLYKASGAEVVEVDGEQFVRLVPGQLKPFKIELTVMIGTIQSSSFEPDQVTLEAIVDRDLSVDGMGIVRVWDTDARITLPVKFVKIIEEAT